MGVHFNATVDSARGEIKLGSGWRAELYLLRRAEDVLRAAHIQTNTHLNKKARPLIQEAS